MSAVSQFREAVAKSRKMYSEREQINWLKTKWLRFCKDDPELFLLSML
jgi:uncharacterized protein YqiB (DUF1249 family)